MPSMLYQNNRFKSTLSTLIRSKYNQTITEIYLPT